MPIKLFPPKTGKTRSTPYWHIRGTYLGVQVNRSSQSGKREVAVKLKRQIEYQIESNTYAKPGDPTFASAAIAYMQGGGERTYVGKLLSYFGDRPLSQFDQAAIDRAAHELYPTGSAATRNRSVYTPTSAILRYAGYGFDMRRPKGAAGNRATAWLWPEQAERLFEEAGKIDKEFEALLIVLTYTGLRLSEALKLEWNNVRLQDGFAYVPDTDTKNDEPRAVFLPPVAVAAMGNLSNNGARRCFQFSKGGHIYSLLRAAAFRAAVDLPRRSAFHILRHTYGTWMRRYGGLDTRGLVGTGAWKDIKSAERYAHVVVTEEAQRAERLPIPRRKKG